MFGTYPLLISFFGPFLFGEAVFIFLAFFIGMNELNLLPMLIILGSLADVSNDIFWFYVPRWNFLKRMRIFEKILKKVKIENRKLKKIEQKNLFYFIIGCKFLIGTRLLSTVSISLNKIKSRKFIIASLWSAFFWSIIVVFIGWTAGRGFLFVQEMFNDARVGASMIVVFVIFIVVIRKYLHNHSLKRLVKLRGGKNGKFH